MWEWLSKDAAPAWVQAIGSVAAILVAVAVPAWQRLSALRDAKIEKDRQEKELLRRLVTGLRAEVNAAMETAKRQQLAAEGALADLARARQAGVTIARGDVLVDQKKQLLDLHGRESSPPLRAECRQHDRLSGGELAQCGFSGP
jgi:hypothetical protein